MSVCERHQTVAYCKLTQISFTVLPSAKSITFGYMVLNSFGIMKFIFPRPDGGLFNIFIDVSDIVFPYSCNFDI